MANKIIHKRSSALLENGKPKLPTADNLEYGELAINFAKGAETISFKNKADEIVTISSTERIEQIILDNEEVTAAALTDLDERVLAMENGSLGYATMEDIYAEGFLSFIPSEYVTEAELANKRFLTSVPAEYVTETELDNRGYLTSVPDEYITETDLDNRGYLTSIPAEYVTETELSNKGYLTSVPAEYVTETELSNKGYLTSVPDEYVTEAELANKGYATSSYVIGELNTKSNTGHTHSEYLTEHQDISGKQDVISDLNTIRSGAAKGATALQSVPAEYITETELANKNYATSSYVIGELAKKSDTGHTHSEYLTEHQDISGKQDVISDLATIRSGASKGATALQSVPSEYVTETELNGKGYATSSYVDGRFDTVNSSIDTLNATVGTNNSGKNLSERITTVENYTAPDARANVLWIGTSIPAGDIQHGNNGTTQSTTTNLGSNNYPKMVADALGFNLYNNSRGSSFVCFYPPNEDGTANWASASDWSEYSSEVWKGYSLSASFAQVDEKFGPNGLNCPQWLINNFKSYSYESLIIPYIDGTLASCDTVVIDHGYNDRKVIINEASWHPGEGETQFTVGAGRDWLLKLQDPFETTNETEGYFQGKWWNDESVSSKKHYMSAMIFLAKKIWAVNPKIKIIIGNYFTSKSNVFASDFGNDRLGEFVHLANSAIASWLRVNCVEVWHHTGIYNRNLPAGNDYQLFCPDGVHPHSDSTGHSNKVIAGVYINAIKGTLYR